VAVRAAVFVLVIMLGPAALPAPPQSPADSAAVADSLAIAAPYAAGDLAASRAAAEAALQRRPDAYAAQWQLARVLIDLGNREQAKPARQDLYAQAREHARRAVELRPDDTWGHHYLAAAAGKLALTAGGRTKVDMSREVRDEAQKAVELDPRNDKSWHILGRWNREMANLSPILKLAAKVVYGGLPAGASNERAVECFEKAIAIAPAHVNHHLELGLTYMETHRYDLAGAEFETALALPDRDPNDPDYKAEAARQLEKAKRAAAAPRRDVSR
jgi:tetratricopeptide (TPR) repeat protein